MTFKKLLLCLLTIFTVILYASFILASHSVLPTSLKFVDPTTSQSFTLTPPSTGASYTLTPPIIPQDDGNAIVFTSSGDLGAVTPITTPKTITVNATVNYRKLNIGKTYSGNIVLKNTADSTDTLNLPVSFIGSFCKQGEKGTDLEITKIRIDNEDGDDDEWTPLDKIEIKVEVSNNANERVKEVFVELGLFDSQGKNVIKDMDDLDDEEVDLGSIKDSDEETAVFTFTVPADFETDNYKLTAKAFSKDAGEENLCTAKSSDLEDTFFQVISGEREEDEEKHVIVNNIKVSPETAQCGERVQVSGEVVNIGDADYENQVRVNLFNQELGIKLEKVIREDFDQGDSQVFDFEFLIPKIAEKIYTLEFSTDYDYDEDDNTYDISSEERFTGIVKVQGNCEEEVKSVKISAELDVETPEAVAGKRVIINAKLENTGSSQTVYTVSVVGNEEWSDIVSIDPQVVSLAPGESKEVVIVLGVNPDAQGDKELTVKTSFNGQTTEQKVALPVLLKPGQELTPFVENIRGNWFIYLIIVVNVILIIAIILVIRSMVSPRPL